jgi:peptidoglycan/xylan/chitin deacetylase (PgdA/CDA1 family)
MVVAYHGVADADRFERQVQYLSRRHHPLKLKQVIQAVRDGRPLPEGAVLVTFDDGDKSIVEKALPVMRAYRVPGVLFAVSGRIGSDEPFWWDEARDLASRGGRAEGAPLLDPDGVVRWLKRVPEERRLAGLEELRRTATGTPTKFRASLSAAELQLLDGEGIDVENHTATHPSLDQCDPATIEREIQEAHEQLSTLLGRRLTAFAYPGGYYADGAREVLERIGYRVAFIFDHRSNRWPPPDPLRVSRLRLDPTASVDRAAIILSGLHPAILHARGRP